MSIDGLLAVVGLLFAAYQIMPRPRQLELAFQFRFPDRALVAIALGIILYLQFYSFFSALGLSPHLGLSRWNLTPERASLVVAGLALSAVYIRIRRSKLSPRQIHKFGVLLDELWWSESYSELLKLLRGNLKELINISKDRTPLSRLHFSSLLL